jgi:tRNA threonylcarbamoyladenosine modification (KEOPS) complex Cgi121 subunit
MLQYLKDYGKYVEITGYYDIEFDKIELFLKANRKETKKNVDLQFFDAQLIATQEHLYFAVLNALQAFKNKTNISKSPAMETLLYASAHRQIQKAINRAGIKPETQNMALVIVGDDPKQIETTLEAVTKSVGCEPDERVLDLTKNKEAKIKKTFEITEEELKVLENGDQKKAIANLVIERIALLSTQL